MEGGYGENMEMRSRAQGFEASIPQHLKADREWDVPLPEL